MRQAREWRATRALARRVRASSDSWSRRRLPAARGRRAAAEALSYEPVDLADPESFATALGATPGPVAVYLALPPAVFATTLASLRDAGLPPGSRVVVEKPLGDDAGSARALNTLLARTGDNPYRVDHVLGMATTRNLVALRRGNTILERLWNGESVEQVDILWDETLGLEGRAGYFDHAGALKDVLQNHMLQLLALVAMDVPGSDADLHARKVDALRSARATAGSRRARYSAGTLADGRHVSAYADQEGVDAARGTETFAEVVFEVGTPRWAGTRFVLRGGKALTRRRKLVLLRFRDGGELEVGIDGPDDIVVRLRGVGNDLLELRAPVPGDGLPPYAHVLLDVLSGTGTLSVSGDEAEQAWHVVAPVLASWQDGGVPLEEYVAGSAGPS